ncbi:MAG: TIR domain-containing protein [Candidatus Humimicrobiaceae bacterium]
MEQNNKKNLKKYLDLVMLGEQTLKKHGWNQNINNMFSKGDPSNEEYSGYLTSCISLIEDTLGKESPSYLMIKKLIDNEKTSKIPYYFADCFGIIKTAYGIYNEKILSENKLDILLDKIEELLNTASCFNDTKKYDTDFMLWYRDFKNIFETYEFVNITYERVFNILKFEAEERNPRYEGLNEKESFAQDIGICIFYLEKMKQDINTYGERAIKIKKQKKIKEIVKNFNNKQVFIVHGHNIEKKVTTARIIEKLGLEPIILHEQANKGRTILKKLSESSDDVNFVIILLTADDVGKAEKDPELKQRARQNVVFELGYFIAKLGEKNVCSIYEDGVEIPTDYLGVTFIPFDSAEKWKFDLVKELKAAGFDVDANILL